MTVKIASSILSADFAHLGLQVQEAINAGTDYIHIDIMDGHFVPNMTVGPLIVSAIKPIALAANIPLDVHLMIEKPERLISEFAKAGSDIITVHVETCPNLHRTIQQIEELGVSPGVTLNPATSLITLEEILPSINRVLIMSVNPGFGGQSYISSSTSKIARLHHMLDDQGLQEVEIAVDGGIKTDNVPDIVQAGANVLVVGSAIFNQSASPAENIAALRHAADSNTSP